MDQKKKLSDRFNSILARKRSMGLSVNNSYDRMQAARQAAQEIMPSQVAMYDTMMREKRMADMEEEEKRLGLRAARLKLKQASEE